MAKQKLNRDALRQLLADRRGLRQADIARKFGVSRERIRQLNNAFGYSTSKVQQREAAINLVKPFESAVMKERRMCVLCRSAAVKRGATLCDKCAAVRKWIGYMVVHLRIWRKTKRMDALHKAAHIIRTGNLTVDDVRAFYLCCCGKES